MSTSLHPAAQRVRTRVGPGLQHVAAHVRVVPVQEEPGDGRRGEVLLRGVLRGGGHLGGGGDGGAERVDVVALAQSLLRRRGGDRRGDHRRVHRGGGDVGGGSLGEEFASQRNVLLHAEAVLEAVPELALGIRRPEEDVPPGAERRARLRVLVLALAAGAVEVHDGEGVVRVGRPGDGGAREERGAASAPSRSELGGLADRVAAVKSTLPTRKAAKTLPASTAASAKADAPSFQFSAVALDRTACGGRNGGEARQTDVFARAEERGKKFDRGEEKLPLKGFGKFGRGAGW